MAFSLKNKVNIIRWNFWRQGLILMSSYKYFF